jgi:hypothetical protein|tara:strand:- start:63 stop:254 length:192 start_codon:yes stop_codon:yes gene_type:complete
MIPSDDSATSPDNPLIACFQQRFQQVFDLLSQNVRTVEGGNESLRKANWEERKQGVEFSLLWK